MADRFYREKPAAAQRGAVSDSIAEILESLAVDIEAIGVMHRGAPSYEHDAYWMRERAAAVVRDLASRLAAAPYPPAPEPCPHSAEPRGCYRVRCQLSRKCAAQDRPPRAEGGPSDDELTALSDRFWFHRGDQTSRQAAAEFAREILRRFGVDGAEGR